MSWEELKEENTLTVILGAVTTQWNFYILFGQLSEIRISTPDRR